MPSYSTPSQPVSLASGDINGDGIVDVVTAGFTTGSLSVYLGTGNGGLNPIGQVAAAVTPRGVSLADMNGDGRLDLITTRAVLLGNGDGTFGAALAFAGGPNPAQVAVADFDLDGRLDLAVSNAGSTRTQPAIVILLGLGNGTFMAGKSILLQFGAGELAVADINKDGRPDIAVSNESAIGFTGGSGNYGMVTLLNTGGGNFTQNGNAFVDNVSGGSGSVFGGSRPIATGDLNEDGLADFAITNGLGRTSVLIAKAVGGYELPRYVPGGGESDLVIVDVNGDGHLDLVTAGSSTGAALTIFYGTGAGTFGGANPVQPGASAYAVVAAMLNADSRPDFVTVSSSANTVSTITSTAGFKASMLASHEFGAGPAAGGWTNDDLFPRRFGDVNGDGRTDIVAFGEYGVTIALGRADGTFAPSFASIRGFGHDPSAGGLTDANIYPREVADVNGDGRDDIIGFGDAGTYVSLATGDGTFAAPFLATNQFGVSAEAGSWISDDRTPRVLADVNGDGRADLIGFGEAGTYVALAGADGHFGAATLAIAQFGFGVGAGGWTDNDVYRRSAGDVNGDGFADIIGFGDHGAYVALGRGDGSFGAQDLAVNSFGAAAGAGGWINETTYPRTIADVNGDGRADIVGFGEIGVYISYGQQDGSFSFPALTLRNFAHDPAAGGLTNGDIYPRGAGDVNGDGIGDLIGVGDAGVYVALGSLGFNA